MILLQTATIQVTRTESVFDIILKAGWILIPILLMSIIAIYFIIERFTLLSSVNKINTNFINDICKRIKSKDYSGALTISKNYQHPIGRIVTAGIENIKLPVKDIEQTIADEAKSEIFLLEKNMGYIGIIATVAPMFGFLGTIFGVIKIFYNISLADNISIGIIAGGLYQKMVSSASGLTVGIIAYASFYYLNTMIDNITHKMEKPLSQIVNAVKETQS